MTPCINWTGSKDVYGYGRFKSGGKTYKAHRVAYERAMGVKLSISEHICHRCDNPSCINPEHLFVGDSRVNALDRHAKGRDAKGITHGMSKLNEVDVERIKDICKHGGQSFKAIARIFGVSDTQVRNIANGRQRVAA